MAIYKLFPYKDATLYSFYPNMNTGIDSITSISNLNIAVDSNPQVARFLTEFVQDEIEDVINNKISGSQWDVDFRSYIATAQGIVEATDISVHPLAQYWYNGTGTYLDQPITSDGCAWYSPYFKNSDVPWSGSGTDNTNNYVTSSYNPNFVMAGGGSWYHSSSDGTLYAVTQSFDIRTVKDLKINAKTVVEKWYSGSFANNGFITKWENNVEWNISPQIQPVMQFYSVDTNTIYPPQLEFKWRDYSSVLTGSATIKDLDTNEIVVDYDTNYTQLSSDIKGNYFDVYMNGLEPERYYKVCIKTNINGSTLILDDNYYFKIVNSY